MCLTFKFLGCKHMRDNLQFCCSHLCCSHFTKCNTHIFRMTDSMNFGPDWIRNLSSEGTTGGGGSGGTRYQLADYRYGREEMLALFDKNTKPPVSITNFKCLYSETCLQPLALLPVSDEEQRGGWQGRPNTIISGPPRGRGGSLERGGRISRGRGYQYGRPTGTYEGGWGNGEQPDWSPRKEYGNQRMSSDNWRRARNNEEDEWRSGTGPGRTGGHEKWGRSTSWRGEGDSEERTGPPEKGGRTSWNENRAALMSRKSWESEDHLPEWATENPTEGGGTFDEKGAFHGSDDEQPEIKPPNKRDTILQKSTSQQHISSRSHPPPMSSSKSTLSLVKHEDTSHKNEIIHESLSRQKEEDIVHSIKQKDLLEERKKSVPNISEKIDKDLVHQERAKSEGPPKLTKLYEKPLMMSNGPVDIPRPDDSEFEKLQEDFVLKLVVDEDMPKQVPNNYDVSSIQPPPNLVASPIMDKWYYQDPQGQMQGPFSNAEMAEWYKAGYFSNQLNVRRQCDERFFLLGELITLCAGANPFQSGIRFPLLKNESIPKIATEPDILQLQYLSQMAAYKQAQARLLSEPWNAITLQQQEIAAQRLIMQQQQQQQQQQVSQDLQYLQQSQAANPLMHMINQMQQANKLPGQGLVEKQPQNIPGNLDPHLQLHMSNLLSMQNRLPTTALPNNIPAGLGNALPGNLPQPEGLSTNMPSLQAPQLNTGNMPIGGIQSNIPVSIGGSINIPRPTSRGSEQIPSSQSDPISSLLKQLQQQKQSTTQQVDNLWQQNSFPPNNGTSQWQQSQNEVPISMWDIQNTAPQTAPSPPLTQSEKLQQALQPKPTKVDKEKEQQKLKEESLAKELKKKKELEEKQAKKDAEEKRKQDQRRLEAEKKSLEEKRRKEEERVKRELDKAKKEAEEKRLRELEEKRRLKEQRKLEEEAKKRTEEQKKLDEDKIRQEIKEKETRRQEEEKRLQQEQQRLAAKVAPWSQSNSNMGLSLTEIQKAEKEKRALDAALQIQRLQEKEQQQQLQQEKAPIAQFKWAKKPVEPRKVKSLAEIQAEEQEKLLKQAAETRLQKEKEPLPVTNNTGTSIWSSQNLTWASSSANWSSSGGFWDDSSNKQGVTKPSTVTKSNSANNFTTTSTKPQTQKLVKTTAKSTKKEETNKSNHNNNNINGPSSDEFMNWCYKTLSNISTNVDIPTFVTFLRDIESAFDVKEYCKEYLGDSNATHQFALNFLEKRRSFKPRNNAHTDDMCSPAPAITPSLQHSTEFQEVKGKNKKNKKSKMLKVDSRILGFNVTSAPDRINVGDRDYGDNS